MMKTLTLATAVLAGVAVATTCPGAAAVKLNNDEAGMPIFGPYGGLLPVTNAFVQVWGGPEGSSLAPLVDATGSPIIMGLIEPGFFDGGVGIVPGVVDSANAEFQLRAWVGGTNFDTAVARTTGSPWVQRTGSSVAGMGGPAPLKVSSCLFFFWPEPPYGRLALLPRGHGQVLILPSQAYYLQTDVVVVQAVPDPGYGFAGWWGDLAGSGSIVARQVGWHLAGLAVFKPVWRLDLAAGLGGRIRVSPAVDQYLDGTTVAVQAIPNNHFGFRNWTGDLGGTNALATILMDTNKSIGAAFAPLELPLLLALGASTNEGPRADGFNLLLFGQPSGRYEIQTSADLLTWAPLATLTTPTNPVLFLDAGATNLARRFYRAQER